jgi:2'-5' RNA ligase
MPYAFTMLLDRVAGLKISSMYKVLSDRGISHDQVKLAYAPHITLAIFDDRADLNQIIRLLSLTTSSWSPISVPLIGYAIFSGTPSTLCVCAGMTSDLFQRHSNLCSAIPGELPLREHYQPDRWFPHVTLAKDLSDPVAALAAVLALELPPHATCAELNLIHFRPARVLWEKRLDGH